MVIEPAAIPEPAVKFADVNGKLILKLPAPEPLSVKNLPITVTNLPIFVYETDSGSGAGSKN